MLKNITYKDKFAMLQEWMPFIVDAIKRDLRNEHLRNDVAFMKRYFPGKHPTKLTAAELAPAYIDVMANGDKTEEVGEFLTNRWLLKHSDLYHHFEQELSKICSDFNELTIIEKPTAMKIMEDAVEQFGPIQTYLFCVLNSVVFPEDVYALLGKKASLHAQSRQIEEEQEREAASMDALKRGYEQQIARLTDKYEKRLLGFEKKYTQDINSLKKQIASLQKKSSGV
ncbi:MAG: hypothetical protein WCG42_07820 [Parachlamydiaceae bacterium]